MLDDGVPVDSEYGIATALKYAAMMNRTDVTQMLLKGGANVDKRSGSYQSTALHQAAWNNNIDVIEVLLKYGASKKIKDDDGSTPIDWVHAQNNEAAVRLLERH